VSERSVDPAPLCTKLEPSIPEGDYRKCLVDGLWRACKGLVEGLTSREGIDIVRGFKTQRFKDDSVHT